MSAFHKKIVVWERSNKLGKWCPYSADICQLFEEKHKDTLNVCLGDVNNDLKVYSVNFKDMIQISEATGTKLPIRRHLCDTLSVLGRGFSWQWLDDHDNWNTYDTDINDYIDNAFLEGKRSVSLGRKFPGYNYEIIFSKMSQMNKHSKRKRKVRRQENSSPYPTVDSSDDSVDSDKKNHVNEVQEILSPEFLAQEIPGTSSLVNQVNAYKRNVESPVHIDDSSIDLKQNDDDNDGLDCSKHLKFSTVVEQDKHSNLVPSSSMSDNTVALVHGKPYYYSKPPHTPQSKIKPVPGIDPLPKVEKPKRTKKKGRSNVQTQEVVSASVLDQYTELVDLSPAVSAETCIICCESLSSGSSYNDDKTVSKLILCSHMFHKACLEAMYNSNIKEFLQCPSCKKIYGEKCGMQPPGEMIYHVLPYSLPGYPENDTIRIIYDIKSGVQGPEHPNPGRGYTARGFPRHCFLPDNEMGRKILRLLIKAWKRRLIFTIGRSSTTGEEDTVTWNEIHHKTEFGFNGRGHGYPDPNYFNNVLEELEAQGVIDDEARIWYPA